MTPLSETFRENPRLIHRTPFPSKNLWKREGSARIISNRIALWENRISTVEFSDFKCLHNVYEPHWLWQFAKGNPQVFHCCRSVIQMIAGVPNESLGPRLCSLCYVTPISVANCPKALNLISNECYHIVL